MPSPTYKTPHAVQEPQPIKRLSISPPSIVILQVLTSSSQLPLKLPGHGTRWLLNWFKRLADGSHLSPRTAERQYFTARCYASAVLAMGLCLCLSVCHKSEFY